MALDRAKKVEVVADIKKLLSESKLTVVANYSGTTVKSMQELRTQAKESNTSVKVYKNRLVKLAMDGDDRFKSTDKALLTGQLLYAFNAEDEVAPAQVLAKFAKGQPQLTFVGAINAEGQFISAEDVTVLSNLPSKDQLRAQLVGTLSAPLGGVINVVSGNIIGLINVLNAKGAN